jgi:hypothetical protein
MFIARVVLSLCVGVVLVAPCAGLARATQATPVVVIPKPDLSSMNFLLGTWSCSKQTSSRPAPYTAMVTYAVSPGGRWIEQTSVWNPVPWFPNKWISHDEITYDSYRKRWVDVEYDDIGGYSVTTSRGWAGNTSVWHDPAFIPSSKVVSETDATMTKVSSSKVTWSWSLISNNGKTISEHNTCTKS